MATLTPTLTLTSTTATSDSLSVSLTPSLNVENPIIATARDTAPVSGGSAIELVPASQASIVYVYVYHTSKQGDGTTTSTDTCVISDGTNNFIDLNPGEFCFFPSKGSTAVKAISADASNTIQIEYGTFKKA